MKSIDNAKIKVFKIKPGIGLNPCCEKDSTAIVPWLEEAGVGEKITVEVLEMDESEYAALPEYMGP